MNYYQNPILSGFHPDPSICRVGDDYYLVTSSFHYFPGLPLFHSRDLVHWSQIGHAIDRSGQLCMEGIGPSGGLFAPTLRHHKGLFYLICTHVGGPGNFVITAADPAGPWSDPVWIDGAPGIDPSLFFDDDGRCWYQGNGDPEVPLYDGHHTIWLQEFDLSTFQLVGERHVIVDGGSNISRKPIWIEGPHIYKLGGMYYLFAAEGGTADWHTEVVFRSQSITGPYESYSGNPVFTNRHLDPGRSAPITCTGHADLVQTQNDEWWLVCLACRPYEANLFNIGRETFLAPVRWEGGWPVVGDGTLRHRYPAPDLPSTVDACPQDYGLGNFSVIDDFTAPQLARYWNQIRTSSGEWFSLSARPSYLRMHLKAEALDGTGNPSFLGIRQRHANFSAQTLMEFVPSTTGDAAGICVIQNSTAYYALQCVLGKSGRELQFVKRLPGGDPRPHVIESLAIDNVALWLKIEAAGKEYSFYYAERLGDWIRIGEAQDGRILSTQYAGGFVGAYVGLFGCANAEASGAFADFDGFLYDGMESDIAE